jgi:phosphotransacetylase
LCRRRKTRTAGTKVRNSEPASAGTAPSASLVSSVFFRCLPDEVVVYGDCAVNPDPDASRLADIAPQSAASAACSASSRGSR